MQLDDGDGVQSDDGTLLSALAAIPIGDERYPHGTGDAAYEVQEGRRGRETGMNHVNAEATTPNPVMFSASIPAPFVIRAAVPA